MYFTVIYLTGILSCAIQGTAKAIEKSRFPALAFVYSFIASLGGGMTRDILLLKTTPVAFTNECIPEVILCVLSVHIFYAIRSSSWYNFAVDICDGIGVGCFIVIGVDKALSFRMPAYLIFASGVITAIGGGIVASIICGISLKTIFGSNIFYRITIVFGTLLYMLGYHEQTVILFVSFFVLVSNSRIHTAVIKKLTASAISILPYTVHNDLSFRLLVVTCLIKCRTFLIKRLTRQQNFITAKRFHSSTSNAYLRFHNIRLMLN